MNVQLSSFFLDRLVTTCWLSYSVLLRTWYKINMYVQSAQSFQLSCNILEKNAHKMLGFFFKQKLNETGRILVLLRFRVKHYLFVRRQDYWMRI